MLSIGQSELYHVMVQRKYIRLDSDDSSLHDVELAVIGVQL